MIFKKNISILFILCIVLSCTRKERIQKEYFDNGNLKKEIHQQKGSSELCITEFYRSGKLKSRKFLLDGRLDKYFVDYFPNGEIYREGKLKNGRMIKMTYYYESGVLREELSFDSLGTIKNSNIFKPNGERDSLPKPYTYIPYSDTIEMGSKKKFICKVLNLIDPRYTLDKLIITSKLDSTFYLKDTLNIITPVNNEFEYAIPSNKRGENHILGMLYLIKDEGDSYVLTSVKIEYVYFVK